MRRVVNRACAPEVAIFAASCGLALVSVSQFAGDRGGLSDILRSYGPVVQSVEWVMLGLFAFTFGYHFDRGRQLLTSCVAAALGGGLAFTAVVAQVGMDPWDIRVAGTYTCLPLLVTATAIASYRTARALFESTRTIRRSPRSPLVLGVLLQSATVTLAMLLPLDAGPPPVPVAQGWFWLAATLTGIALPTTFYVLGLIRAARGERMLDAWFALLLTAPMGGLAALQVISRVAGE